jgi:hypothetical protein
MLDVITEFQIAAFRFDATVLALPGIAGVVVGTVVWLAGVRVTRIIALIIGAFAGATLAGYFSVSHDVKVIFSAAIVGAIVAMLIHKPVVAVAGTVAFLSILLMFFVNIYFGDKGTITYHERLPAATETKLATTESVRQAKIHLTNIADRFISLSQKLLQRTKLIGAITLLIVLLLAVFWWRLFMAISFSSLGATTILAGITCLLLYNGSAWLTYMYQQFNYFFVLFLAMVAAGTASQLVLCRPQKLKIVEQEEQQQKEKDNMLKPLK